MEIFVGAIALQFRTQRSKKHKRNEQKEKSWKEQVKRSAEILSEKLGVSFNEEEFIKYAEVEE